MSKVMIIGAVGSGKSHLTEKLLHSSEAAVKTQALSYRDWVVDTPGEYTENPLYYKALMATALEVTDILLVQDATSTRCIFPPGFMMGIPKRVLGVITKSDASCANIEKARQYLQLVMPSIPIIVTSSVTGEGIEQLLTALDRSPM